MPVMFIFPDLDVSLPSGELISKSVDVSFPIGKIDVHRGKPSNDMSGIFIFPDLDVSFPLGMLMFTSVDVSFPKGILMLIGEQI